MKDKIWLLCVVLLGIFNISNQIQTNRLENLLNRYQDTTIAISISDGIVFDSMINWNLQVSKTVLKIGKHIIEKDSLDSINNIKNKKYFLMIFNKIDSI